MLNYAIAPAVARKRTGIVSTFATYAAVAIVAAHRWYRRRLTIHRLSELDDRMLKDIGLDRTEIESVARTAWHGRHRAYINHDLYRNDR